MNTYTCRYFKDVLDVVFTLCVGLLCCLHLDFSFKTGSHVPPTYLLCSQRLQLATDSNQFQWVLTHLWWIADVLRKFMWIHTNQIRAISTIPPVTMDWIVLLEYFVRVDDAHIKYFHCWQLPTTACLSVKLNWTQFSFVGKPVVNACDG